MEENSVYDKAERSLRYGSNTANWIILCRKNIYK